VTVASHYADRAHHRSWHLCCDTQFLISDSSFMPLLVGTSESHSISTGAGHQPRRQNSEQYSELARAAIMSSLNSSPQSGYDTPTSDDGHNSVQPVTGLMPPPKSAFGRTATSNGTAPTKQAPTPHTMGASLGAALTDTPAITPASSAPGSPQMLVLQRNLLQDLSLRPQLRCQYILCTDSS
jgi:hypothetical protein